MKKLILPILLMCVISLGSCASEKSATNKVTTSPKATISVTAAPTQAPTPSAVQGQNSDSEQAEKLYIINGMSSPIYGLYLTSDKEGNPGENIIGDTPLEEGEEIGIPYIYNTTDKLYIIIEDEQGNTSATDSFTLEDGLNIELRKVNGNLEALVQ